MKKKIKILHVYYEPGFSGITRHVGHIVGYPEKDDNFEFSILCSTDDPKISDYYKSINIPVKSVAPSRYFSFRGMIECFRTVRKNRIDIVHVHNLQSIFWAHLAKIFLPKTRFIFTPHVISFENKSIEKIFYIIWRYFSILSKDIVALTKGQKEFLVKKKIKKPEFIQIIPNSVPDSEQTEKKINANSDLENPCVLSAIRFVGQKNPMEIIRIAEKVCSDITGVKFYIAGNGPLFEDMERMIKEKKLEDRVILLGFRKDTLLLMNQADILLSTSLWEGLPYGLLEAMIMGKAIVASDIPGHRDLIMNGENGYLAKTTEDYAKGIKRLIQEPELKENFGKKARSHFTNEFSFSKFRKNIRNLYRSRRQS